MPPLRLSHAVLFATLFAAAAVGATGAILLSRYRVAAVEARAGQQALLVEARARLLDDEVERLVAEMTRLSGLAEVDLADDNPEPEKGVLRIARRDTALFSAAIAIVDARGDLVWSEPRHTAPAAAADLVGRASGLHQAVVALAPGEIDVAAPIAGHGAIVGIVSGQSGDLFGRALQQAAQGGGSLVLEGEGRRVAASGAEPRLASVDQGDQAWAADAEGRRWLVTSARLRAAPLVLRLAQPEAWLTAPVAAPLRGLLAIVAVAVLVALAGGGAVALALGRLARADDELRRSRELAAVGRTAAAIAHEVKNSLNGLSVSLDLLASGRAAPEAARQVHAQARAEIVRLRGVSEDLTLFAGPPRLELAPLELGALCRRATASCADLAAEVGAAVELDLPARPLPAQGDEAKLGSALMNLVRNGLEAMGPGAFGEALGSPPAARERRLRVGAAAVDGEARLTVADSGAGLAPEVRARLFEPFVSTKRTGTGLGLAIAQRVALAHGGRVEAEDRPGGGTVFRLAFPLGDPAGVRRDRGGAR